EAQGQARRPRPPRPPGRPVKAKLADRGRRARRADQSLAYDGDKYKAPRWVPHLHATEYAIYEGIVLSERRLTNGHVELALTDLVLRLRDGIPPLLPDDAPAVTFRPGDEVAFLTWNIREAWRGLIEREGPVATDDLIGILRTLLHSMEAHARHTGPDLGYVAFLDGFIGRAGPPGR
ncbi:MAG: hypothetical protein ACRC33_17510, partial [Gemmataceae bacterium]